MRAGIWVGAGADEGDLGDGRRLEEFGAEGAGGVAGGFVCEARDLGGGEGDGVEVGAAGVGIFAIAGLGLGLVGEIHQSLPEVGFVAEGTGDFLQWVRGFCGGFFGDAQRVARGRAAGFQDDFCAVGGAEGAGGIGVRVGGENFG